MHSGITDTEFFPKLCVVVPACDPSTWKVQAGGLEIQGNPWLYNELEVSLGCMRCHLTEIVHKFLS